MTYFENYEMDKNDEEESVVMMGENIEEDIVVTDKQVEAEAKVVVESVFQNMWRKMEINGRAPISR